MALVALTDNLCKQLDRSGPVLLLLSDLTAPFDTVDHDLLTHRLTTSGVHRVVLKQLICLLQFQGQKVALGERVSARHPIICGVLQEAILSPMLFNNYMCPPAP